MRKRNCKLERNGAQAFARSEFNRFEIACAEAFYASRLGALMKADSTERVRKGRGLTAQEAASILGVKVSTLAKWRQLGVGPPYSDSLGRDPRYHPDDLDDFLWGRGVVVNSVEAKHRRKRRTAHLG